MCVRCGSRRRGRGEVVRKLPVFLIMPRAIAFPGKAGDLIALKAIDGENAAHGLIHGPAFFFAGASELAPLSELRHARTVFEYEAVDGHVIHGKMDSPAEARFEVFDGLAGKLVHEVEAEIMKPIRYARFTAVSASLAVCRRPMAESR